MPRAVGSGEAAAPSVGAVNLEEIEPEEGSGHRPGSTPSRCERISAWIKASKPGRTRVGSGSRDPPKRSDGNGKGAALPDEGGALRGGRSP